MRRKLEVRYHSPTKQAIFNHQGKRFYLGPWPNYPSDPPKEVEVAFRRVLARIASGEEESATPSHPTGPEIQITLATLADRWLTWAEGRYRDHPGNLDTLKSGIRTLVDLYATEPASSIGPRKIAEAQRVMAKEGRTRQGINRATVVMRAMITWGVSQEYLPPDRILAVKSVQSLRYGAIKAPESKARVAVPLEVVAATLPEVSPTIAAMVRLQAMTGMRPAEVCALNMGEIDRSDPKCWVYRPAHHKMAHLGRHRLVPLVQEAIALLTPFLRADGKPLFSPADCVEELNRVKRENRKTKVQPSQVDRSKPNPMVVPGDQYTTASYRRAIERACARVRKVNPSHPTWTPNMLRKLAAQQVADMQGLEAARALLGHSDSEVTSRHYAHKDLEAAKVAARELAAKAL